MQTPTDESSPENPRKNRAACLFLVLAVTAAWAPLCRSYIRFGDDFHFTSWLLSGGLPCYFRMHGFWRIIGHGLGNSLPLLHPLAMGWLTLFTHIACVLLFFHLARLLLGSTTLSMTLSLILGAFPWADQVLTWASAYSYSLATVFFLTNLLVLVRHAQKGGSVVRDGLLCFGLSLLSLLTHETLFFALSFSGAILWFLSGRDKSPSWPVMVAPSVACLVWAGLYKAFPGEQTIEHPSLNPRTLLSGIYYQYTNWEIFEPWWKPGARRLLFFEWSPALVLVAAVLVTAFVAAGLLLVKHNSGEDQTHPARRPLLLFFIGLLFCGIAIYAVGDGFSLDSRKKYTLLPLLLLVAGMILRSAGFDRRAARLMDTRLLVLIGLAGIFTTWLQIALWRFEAKRMDLLATSLAAQPDGWAERVRITWPSSIQAAWPRCDQHWGVPVDGFMIRDAVALKIRLAPPQTRAPAVTSLRFNPERFTWEGRTVPEPR